MSVLVGGGSGFVGTALVKALKLSGFRTQIISRTAGPTEARLSWGMIGKYGLPDDCRAVINLSGANIATAFKSWPKYKKEVFDSRINTTKMLADAIVKVGKNAPKVFITASAVGYYPASETAEYTEDSAGGGSEDYFTSLCRDWEAAGNLPGDVPTRRVVVRLGLVMGRDGGIVQQTILPFWLGGGGPMGSGGQWMPWIHVDDAVGIFVHALKNPDSVSGILNGVAPKACTNKEWARAYAGALWRPALLPTPEFALRMVFGSERARMFTTGQKVIPKRTLESGYNFKYPDIQSAAKEFARLF